MTQWWLCLLLPLLLPSVEPFVVHRTRSIRVLSLIHTLPDHIEAGGKGSGSGQQWRHRLGSYASARRREIVVEFRRNPWTFLTIPVVAALVGWLTNWVGVKMLFYPIEWRGIPLFRWENQPLGLFGWQGIVPAKRLAMATKMVDVTISRLLKVSEVFGRLEPDRMAKLLSPTVSSAVYGGWMPGVLVRFFLRRTSRDMLRNIERVVDVKTLVVTGMTTDPTILGSFFQRVGAKELQFLIDSGFGFGFLLGVLQMVQWMFYPRNWTLPVGGAIVGFITNWIALKWIFEPLVPTKVGPFVLQGMFLKRQAEVSRDFSAYIADNILTSQKVWQGIFEESHALREFTGIVRRSVPLPSAAVANIISTCRQQVGRAANHPLHAYMNCRLDLKATLVERMNRLTAAEFEQVLHPIFQEDELTLVVAGAVLGAIAGGLQMALNVWLSKKAAAAAAKKEKETTTKAGLL